MARRRIGRRGFLRSAGLGAAWLASGSAGGHPPGPAGTPAGSAGPAVASAVPAADPRGELRVYISVDDHTDYLWSGDEDACRRAFVEMLDYYVAQADRTASDPPDYQGRFACDGSFWLWTYERARPGKPFARLIERIRSGHITVPITPLVVCYGGTPAEGVLRGLYYAGRIEREHKLRLPLARVVESQVLPYGLGGLLAGAGARYLWHGVCACATKVPGGCRKPRQHEVYWWAGRGGRRLLTKWYTLWQGSNKSLGGYAEARHPARAIRFVSASEAFARRHRWPVIGLFGKGWDDLSTRTDEFVKVARAESKPGRRVIVSNEVDYFGDLERTCGREVPEFAAAFGNEWDVLVASMAEVTASVRRAVERLRAAEAMAALVCSRRPDLLVDRREARERAWMNLGLYYEHDWCANGRVSRKDRARWQRRIASGVTGYVDALASDATKALAGMVRKPAGRRRLLAFNPLGWARTDAVDVPYDGEAVPAVVDVATGKPAPAEVIPLAGRRVLRVLATDLPPVGYKVYELGEAAAPASPAASAPTAAGDVLDDARYRVRLAGSGAVVSVLDKARGGRELIRRVGGQFANDLGGGEGRVEVESAGGVSATLRATAPTPLPHVTRVTLVRGVDRIAIRNEITANFRDVRTWSFGLNLDQPTCRHEEVGAVIRARRLADGGHYSPINARTDWLTLNHFVDVAGQGGDGVTLSSADCCFFRLGESTPGRLDTKTPRLRVLAGGQVDGPGLGIPAQDGDERFLQRFALRGHGAYDEAAAMRFALEHQNPPVGVWLGEGGADLPAEGFSLVRVADPDVLLWALKPAEDDPAGAVVARLWNLGGEPASAGLQWRGGELAGAERITHIETPEGPARVGDGVLGDRLAAHGMSSFLLRTRG